MTEAAWRGHTSKTAASLLARLKESQAAGTRFSHSERMMYAACEFWIAAVARTLPQYLGRMPLIVLRDAEAACAAIELECIASILAAVRRGPLASQPAVSAGAVAGAVQSAIDRLQLPVDEMIGKFAIEQTWSRLKQPTFAAMQIPGLSQPAAR
jgi:hypothetical protein